jgi:hypothetical protein
LRNELAQGTIGPNGQLRLHRIGPELLTALREQHAARSHKPARAASGKSPVSPATSANGNPSTVATPPASASNPPNDNQLVAAYRVIDQAGIWFEKLKAELEEVLSRVGAVSTLSFLHEADTTDVDHYSGGDGWVLDGWRWTFPARHRRQRIGALSVIVDIESIQPRGVHYATNATALSSFAGRKP